MYCHYDEIEKKKFYRRNIFNNRTRTEAFCNAIKIKGEEKVARGNNGGKFSFYTQFSSPVSLSFIRLDRSFRLFLHVETGYNASNLQPLRFFKK